MSEVLHIVTCCANPIGWESRIRLARRAIASWLEDPNVHVTVVECAYGSRPYDLADMAGDDRVNHIPVRATTLVWSKECLLNIGLRSLPSTAHKVATFDADITYRKRGWASQIIKALDIYHVCQPWTHCYDLGPNDEALQTFTSFCHVLRQGYPVVGVSNPMLSRIEVHHPEDEESHHHHPEPHHHHHEPHHHHHHHHPNPYPKPPPKPKPHPHPFRGTIEGINPYPHCGFAWAWQYNILMQHVGGLFELGGMGAADHHMALSMIGQGSKSYPQAVHPNYAHAVDTWQNRAHRHFNEKIGIVHQTIEHPWHGRKKNRAYKERWSMFVEHAFDPYCDLKKNATNVLEFVGNKPILERDFDLYMRQRSEDANTTE